MPRGQFPFGNQERHRGGKFQQPDGVGNGAPVLPQPRGHLFLRVTGFLDQVLVRLRLLDRVELLALNVFHQRQFEQPLVGHLPDHRRNLQQARPLGGRKAALPGDQLEIPAEGADEHRLQNPVFADRGRQLFEALLVEEEPGLVRIRGDPVDVDLVRGGLRALDLGDQRPQPPT